MSIEFFKVSLEPFLQVELSGPVCVSQTLRAEEEFGINASPNS